MLKKFLRCIGLCQISILVRDKVLTKVTPLLIFHRREDHKIF